MPRSPGASRCRAIARAGNAELRNTTAGKGKVRTENAHPINRLELSEMVTLPSSSHKRRPSHNQGTHHSAGSSQKNEVLADLLGSMRKQVRSGSSTVHNFGPWVAKTALTTKGTTVHKGKSSANSGNKFDIACPSVPV